MRRVDSLEKTRMLGGIGGRRRRGQQVAGWHHQLNGHEFGWTPGVGVGQGGLACCDSWGRQESDTTEWLNWTERLWDEENKHRYAQWHPVFILFSLFKFYVGTACSLWRILISIKKANKPKRKLETILNSVARDTTKAAVAAFHTVFRLPALCASV